jgi:uncharacterized protein
MDLLGVGLGLTVGVILGLIGAGGVMMTIPTLMVAVDFSIVQAATGSLLVVVAASLAGLTGRGTSQLRIRYALILGLAGAPFASIGSFVAVRLSEVWLELLLVGIMFYAAYSMWNRATEDVDVAEPVVAISILLTIGAVVGFVTGLVGISGGVVLIPAMVLRMGLSISVATTTSLLIIWRVLEGVPMTSADWNLVFIISALAALGSFVGAKFANKIKKKLLQRIFAIFLLCLATAIIFELLGVWEL